MIFDGRLQHHALIASVDEIALDFLPGRLAWRIGKYHCVDRRRRLGSRLPSRLALPLPSVIGAPPRLCAFDYRFPGLCGLAGNLSSPSPIGHPGSPADDIVRRACAGLDSFTTMGTELDGGTPSKGHGPRLLARIDAVGALARHPLLPLCWSSDRDANLQPTFSPFEGSDYRLPPRSTAVGVVSP